MPLKDIRKGEQGRQTELSQKSGYPLYKISKWENTQIRWIWGNVQGH
ncbi:hypothetical protein SAMN04515695_5599 [Pseudovibrio sp. Tun.PSC04-5.I4]|nr:hypothetical protein SAMN04515695_5599 [Pseudovibrio sp. Tun.PSC04-5.I4]